ncbi:MAG: DUF721 domain-containing protein [Patescibacteria group bacterium]
MQAIGDILAKNIRQSGIKKQIDATLTVECFSQIITQLWGESVARKCQGLYLKDRALLVACPSSVVAQELKNQEQRIVSQLNERLGGGVVDGLRFIS